MLRIDLIEKVVRDFCNGLTIEHISKNPSTGISSLDISEKLDILRNNASSDLNKLHRQGKLIKIKGKPTKYFYKKSFENIFNIPLGDKSAECSSLSELVVIPKTIDKTQEDKPKDNSTSDAFNQLIGSNSSLSHIIKLAKASILYPSGLNTILLGDSGVGKSLFAELMYRFGVQNKVFNPKSSFVVFNCADYASNPNLLVSQLFGCVKGAYTGADSDKEGLIEKADGGVLFLDEIHRLPPEGQEMLFLFIDKKKFRRLGEVSGERTSNVLIIAATTENPNSSLLTTFMRRIPSCIRIPNLKERSLNEKLALVTYFYSIEARKINKPIRVNKDCISNFILYNPPGNIGQLTSDIQLSVAVSYLESKMNNLNEVVITKDALPLYTNSTIVNIDANTRKNVEYSLIKRIIYFILIKILN